MSAGPLPPVAHHSSPPPEGTMSFVMASAADHDVNHDSADDSDQFIREDDDSSPSPESDKPRILHHRPPSLFQSAAARKRAAAKSALSSSSRASSSTGPGSPSSALIVPRRAEDWEPWRSVIRDLYITQNVILKDVMAIMEEKHNLRATPKMYKNQLARWRFFKYAIKPRPRGKAEREAAAAEAAAAGDDRSLVTSSSRSPSQSTDGLISPLFHGSSQTRSVQIGLTAVRDFLNRLIRVDPDAKKDMVVVGYQDPCFRFFTASMELFDQGENNQGGLFLRRAFIQIESLVSNMTVKGFSDVCFTIPHLLIECDRLDILAVYLRYLSELALRVNNQPVREVAASLTDLLDDPDAMIRFVMALTKANSDTIAAHTDAKSLERTRKWAYNQYVACQRTSMRGTTAGEGRHNHRMLRVESQSVYWAQHVVMSSPESDALAELWMRRAFPDDFAPRTEALLAMVRDLAANGRLPPPYDRMMECLYIGWLSDYYETVEDWPKVFEWVRRGLDVSAGEQYQVWSIHIEGLMRKHGSPAEADELRSRRLSHDFLEEVRQQVENMTLSLDGK